jgi:hypothetical protein
MAAYDPADLKSGASNEDDEYEYGISQAHASRIADEILADHAKYGEAHEADSGVSKPGPRRNLHLDGDGYGEGR